MSETDQTKHQTTIIFASAIASIFGAVVGVVVTLAFTTTLSIPLFNLFQNRNSEQAIDSKIIELIEEESATIGVVERVTPAVVSVVVKQRRGDIVNHSQSNSFFFSPFQVYPTPTEEEANELIEVSSGTGFFVSGDGYLLTNRHVVDTEDASFFVVTNEGEEIPATLVDTDPFQDIAVLHVEGDGFETVTLGDSSEIQIGQTVIAIGNTLSEFRNTVTKGVISGINRRITAGTSVNSEIIDQAIQTDAAINPGNSGGPLINLRGEVIGINTAVSYEGESVAFAIPINDAKRAVEDIKTYGRIVRPWLGVRYVVVEPETGASDQTFEAGAMIVAGEQPGEVAVFKGSPADQAGLLENDIIVSVDGTFLTQDQSLAEIISVYHPEDQVTLGVLRGSDLLTVDVTLAEYGEDGLES